MASTGAKLAFKRQSDVSAPQADTFIRSAHQAAIVIGDHLYIDGGEVRQGDNQNSTDTQSSRPINDTLSIPLSTSWTNTTVQIRSLSKGDAPNFDFEALWGDASGQSFYAFAGETAYNARPPDDELWRFTLDGGGGGSWAQQTPDASFSNIRRPSLGITTTSNDTAFYIDGYLDFRSDNFITDTSGTHYFINGVVSFNTSSGVWTNSSADPIHDSGPNIFGAAEFMPNFGTKGLLALLGGQQTTSYTGLGEFVGMNNITLYDPATKLWYSQATSGSGGSPPAMERFCTVGAQGQNGTFEIFLYGGAQDASVFGDVWILSMPGFFWSKVFSSSVGRTSHTCVLAGKRQIISIGGLAANTRTLSKTSEDPWLAGGPDPFARGIGVFDMTSLEWTDKFNANADDYQSPDVVNEFYASGRLSNVQWTSDNVRDLFTNSKSSDGPEGGNSSQSSPPAPSRKSHVGAIVGGVLGGLVFLLCLAALVWLFRRRQRRKHFTDGPPYEKSADGRERQMLDSKQISPVELQDQSHVYEMGGRAHSPFELPDHNKFSN